MQRWSRSMATTRSAPAASSARVKPAGTRANLDHRDACEVAGGAGDPRRQIEIEEKVLAERFDAR